MSFLHGIISWNTREKIITGIVGGIFVQSLVLPTPDHPPNTTTSTSIANKKPANKNHHIVMQSKCHSSQNNRLKYKHKYNTYEAPVLLIVSRIHMYPIHIDTLWYFTDMYLWSIRAFRKGYEKRIQLHTRCNRMYNRKT